SVWTRRGRPAPCRGLHATRALDPTLHAKAGPTSDRLAALMSNRHFHEPSLAEKDPEIARLIEAEESREAETMRLIASENYVSRAVLEATGSVLTNKYSEGYPRKRYYEGQQQVDPIEELAIARMKALFGVDHVNVQPYSGSPAN